MSTDQAPNVENIEAALRELQYDRSWIESGMISVENLLRQHADFGKTAYASSPEHLRLRAFAAQRLSQRNRRGSE
ncbi:MAG: hypothetical protein IT432_06450 [Phycisphaerales bacterium]|nr:hypothetical protein [Phycisphaerales bacterium]